MRRNCLSCFSLLLVLLALRLVAQDRNVETIDGWGVVTGPKGDCSIRTDADKLTITVPATPHNLNKAISDLEAPRVLQEIEGDFTIQVKVSGDFAPSAVSTVAPRGKAFNGAGLLLWADEQLFVRLERNVWITEKGDASCYAPLFEVIVGGKPASKSPVVAPASFFRTPATWFRLQRKGNNVIPAFSHDGVEWTTGRPTTLRLPKKLSVGVAAVNTSKKEFSATFEELRLTTR